MKDRSDHPSHHERTLLPLSYISLLIEMCAWTTKTAVVRRCKGSGTDSLKWPLGESCAVCLVDWTNVWQIVVVSPTTEKKQQPQNNNPHKKKTPPKTKQNNNKKKRRKKKDTHKKQTNKRKYKKKKRKKKEKEKITSTLKFHFWLQWSFNTYFNTELPVVMFAQLI